MVYTNTLSHTVTSPGCPASRLLLTEHTSCCKAVGQYCADSQHATKPSCCCPRRSIPVHNISSSALPATQNGCPTVSQHNCSKRRMQKHMCTCSNQPQMRQALQYGLHAAPGCRCWPAETQAGHSCMSGSRSIQGDGPGPDGACVQVCWSPVEHVYHQIPSTLWRQSAPETPHMDEGMVRIPSRRSQQGCL